MADSILDWLDAAEGPQDIYELLGFERFDPDRKRIKEAVAKGTRELLPYQSHNNNKVAQKAMQLLMELGGAEIVISDPEKLQEHDKQVVDLLYDQYAEQNGDDVDSWDRNQLGSWLAKNGRIHASAVDATLEILCPAPVAAEAEQEEDDEAERIAQRKRALAKRKKAIERRRIAAEERKKQLAKQKTKRAEMRLEQMLESMGVRPQTAEGRFRATRRAREERRGQRGKGKGKGKSAKSSKESTRPVRGRGGRGRAQQADSTKWVIIGAGAVLVIGLGLMLFVFRAKPAAATVKITLDPADAVVTVVHVVDPDDSTKNQLLGEDDGVTITKAGNTQTVSFVGADSDAVYEVMARHEKHIENGFKWKPVPK
ncbi:MAG: hypothetical protein O3A00_17855, partial [Planctomycetota bacterium]|nr:hypothetical protein [Planctomycetota bacterium]